jgi:hypothetical protein
MPEFGPLQALILILLLAVMLGASLRMAKIWSDDRMSDRIFKTMRSWWLWSDALLRGWIRALPVGLVGGWFLVVAMAVAALATETMESSLGFGLLAFLVLLLFVSLGMAVSVMLFNRPSFVVPPHLRDSPGALKEWRSARSRRRRPSAQ